MRTLHTSLIKEHKGTEELRMEINILQKALYVNIQELTRPIPYLICLQMKLSTVRPIAMEQL